MRELVSASTHDHLLFFTNGDVSIALKVMKSQDMSSYYVQGLASEAAHEKRPFPPIDETSR